MNYENKFLTAVEEEKISFKNIFNEYKGKSMASALSLNTWSKKRDLVEKIVFQEIEGLSNSIFRERIRESIAIQENNNINCETCDYDKFCYYIDKLNNEKCSTKVLKYNENYCQSIIDTIAFEYLKIVKYIENESNRFENDNSKEFAVLKNKVIEAWNTMFETKLKKIIDDEFNLIIKEVENKVNSNFNSNKRTEG